MNKKLLLVLSLLALLSIAAFWGYFYLNPGEVATSPCNSPSILYVGSDWWRVTCNSNYALVHCTTNLVVEECGTPPLTKLMLVCTQE